MSPLPKRTLRSAPIVVALATTSCEARSSVRIPDGAIGFAIKARGATPIEVSRVDERKDVSLEPSEKLILAVFERDSLVGRDGRPLTEGETRELGVRLRTAPKIPSRGACGRCPVPSLVGPFTLTPGSSCALPPRAAASVVSFEGDSLTTREPETAEADLVSTVLVESAGPCDLAELPDLTHPPSLTLVPRRPAEPYFVESVGSSTSGAWVASGAGFVVGAGANGPRVSSELPLVQAGGFAFLRVNPPTWVTWDSPKLFAETGRDDDEAVELSFGDRVLTRRSLGFARVDASTLELEEDRLLLGGGSLGGSSASLVPRVAVCALSGSGCVDDVLDSPCTRGPVVMTSHGLGMTKTGRAIRRVDDDWQCGAAVPFMIRTDDGLVVVDEISAARIRGEQTIVCAKTIQGRDSGFLIGSIPTEQLTRGSQDELSVTVIVAHLGVYGCRQIFDLEGRLMVAVSAPSGQRSVYELDASGRISNQFSGLGGEPGALFPELPRVGALISTAGRSVVVAAADGSVWRRIEASWELLYGNPDPRAQTTRAVGQGSDGRLLALNAETLVDLGLEGDDTQDRPLLGLPSTPVMAMTRRAATTPLIAGIAGDDRSWLARLDIASGEVASVTEVPGIVTRVVELQPDVHILLDESGRVSATRDGTPIPVSIISASATGHSGPAMPHFVTMDSVEGVGWAGGRRVLARILAEPSRIRVETFWLSTLPEFALQGATEPSRDLDVEAVVVFGADSFDLIVGGDVAGDRGEAEYRHERVKVRPLGTCEGTGQVLSVCAVPGSQEHVERTGHSVTELAGPLQISRNGSLHSASGKIRNPFGQVTASAGSRGRYVLGGTDGRVVELRVED
ncbi:MAG: hypothetical protein HYV07_06375 [Deltaproteobacteria bacterium]|nr:hypothetical protein [Deltaproteobacteria bacterium]